MGRFIAGLLAATSVGVAGMHSVLAADMALHPVSASYLPVASPFSWTGFYLGANVGAGIGTTETSVNVGPALTALSGMPIAATAPLVSETFNGFIGGMQAGYNWQIGVFVLGVEGDFDGAGLQGTAPCAVVLNCTMKHNWFADITGRVGVVAAERTLIYLKGGVAWEGSNFTVGNNINVAGTMVAANAGDSGVQTGSLLGMGVEYAFLPNWSAKLECNYIDFGTRSFNASIAANPAFAGTHLFLARRYRLRSRKTST
jgi:outer membrane immunogenic protein